MRATMYLLRRLLASHARPASPARRRARLALELLEDRAVPAAFHVNSLADAGTGSGLFGDLRYCLTAALATSEADTITFDLSGAVALQSALPTLSGQLTLTGNGQGVTTIGRAA